MLEKGRTLESRKLELEVLRGSTSCNPGKKIVHQVFFRTLWAASAEAGKGDDLTSGAASTGEGPGYNFCLSEAASTGEGPGYNYCLSGAALTGEGPRYNWTSGAASTGEGHGFDWTSWVASMGEGHG
jgi:hypothetical protein